MDALTEKKLIEAMEAAEAASVAAQRAIDAKDIDAAPALITETLMHTLTVLSLAAACGKLEVLQNLAPSVVFYVQVLTKLNGDVFEGIDKIKCGSSIGAVPERSEADHFIELLCKMISNGGLQ